MDDVRELLHHFFEVGLQALVILELVLLDQTLVDVQSHAASLDETPAFVEKGKTKKKKIGGVGGGVGALCVNKILGGRNSARK